MQVYSHQQSHLGTARLTFYIKIYTTFLENKNLIVNFQLPGLFSLNSQFYVPVPFSPFSLDFATFKPGFPHFLSRRSLILHMYPSHSYLTFQEQKEPWALWISHSPGACRTQFFPQNFSHSHNIQEEISLAFAGVWQGDKG